MKQKVNLLVGIALGILAIDLLYGDINKKIKSRRATEKLPSLAFCLTSHMGIGDEIHLVPGWGVLFVAYLGGVFGVRLVHG